MEYEESLISWSLNATVRIVRFRRKVLISLVLTGSGVALLIFNYPIANQGSIMGVFSLYLMVAGLFLIAFGLGYLFHKPMASSEGPPIPGRSINDPNKAVREAYDSKESVYVDTLAGGFSGAGTVGGPAASIWKKERDR
jgi:hypothetical protein